MARSIPLPWFLSSKRAKAITVAAAGTLTLAAAVSAAVVTIPSAPLSAPMPASADAAFMTTIGQQPVADSGQQTAVRFSQVRAYRSAGYQQRVTAAKAAALATAKAAAARQARAAKQAALAVQSAPQAQPVQQAAVVVPAGSAEQIAEQLLSQFGWSAGQFSCLQPLWELESGWDVTAENPGSGAYGIPQALPGAKMATAGPDWETDAATQIRWGLTYIQDRYGSPCGAWDHEEADGWY